MGSATLHVHYMCMTTKWGTTNRLSREADEVDLTGGSAWQQHSMSGRPLLSAGSPLQVVHEGDATAAACYPALVPTCAP